MKFAIFITMLLATSCQLNPQNASSSMEQRLLDFPGVPMNTHFELIAEPTVNDLTIGSPLLITARNISGTSVWFPFDLAPEVYQINGDSTSLLRLASTNQFEQDIVLSPRGQEGSGFFLGVSPIIGAVNDPVTIRIVIVGFEYRFGNKTDDQTGAFIEIELSPK